MNISRAKPETTVTDNYLEMRRTVGKVCAELLTVAQQLGHSQALEIRECMELLQWLEEDNFAFLAYRYSERDETPEGAILRSVPGRSLGTLDDLTREVADNPIPLCNPPDEKALRLCAYPFLVLDKSAKDSTAHRSSQMERIIIKQLDARLNVLGEHCFLGQLTSQGLATPVARIPILRVRLRKLLELDGALTGSHHHQQIVSLVNSLPKDELFRSPPTQLLRDIRLKLAPVHTCAPPMRPRHSQPRAHRPSGPSAL